MEKNALERGWCRIYRGLYLSVSGQFLTLLLLVALVVWAYFKAHDHYENCYWDSIEPTAREGFASYGVGLDAKGEFYELQYDGEPLAPGDISVRSMFGLERSASIRGILNRYRGAAAAANHSLNENETVFRGCFVENRTTGFTAPLSAFGGPPGLVELRISQPAFARLEDLRGERLRRTAAALLLSQDGFDGALSGTLTHPPKTPAEGNLPEKIVQDAVQEGILLTNGVITGSRRPLNEKDERAAIQRYFADWASDAKEGLATALPANQQDLSDAILPKLNESLTKDLLKVAKVENGDLWLVGKFRWLEIIFWTWFGVFTQSLVQHGIALVGGRRDEVWQPRENLRTVAKMFYGPALIVALFFLRDYLTAGTESLEFAYNTPATLGIAFILGMFPTTAYRLLRQVTTTVFRSDLTGSEKRKIVPRNATVKIVANHREPGGVYRLDTLKQNVGNLYTSIIKP